MTKVNWNNYGPCPVCEQTAGKKCINLSYVWYDTPLVYKKFPHEERRNKKGKNQCQ